MLRLLSGIDPLRPFNPEFSGEAPSWPCLVRFIALFDGAVIMPNPWLALPREGCRPLGPRAESTAPCRETA